MYLKHTHNPPWSLSLQIVGYTIKPHDINVHILLPYRQTSNIVRILVGNKIVDHSDVVLASLAGAAPTTSSFST